MAGRGGIKSACGRQPGSLGFYRAGVEIPYQNSGSGHDQRVRRPGASLKVNAKDCRLMVVFNRGEVKQGRPLFDPAFFSPVVRNKNVEARSWSTHGGTVVIGGIYQKPRITTLLGTGPR